MSLVLFWIYFAWIAPETVLAALSVYPAARQCAGIKVHCCARPADGSRARCQEWSWRSSRPNAASCAALWARSAYRAGGWSAAASLAAAQCRKAATRPLS